MVQIRFGALVSKNILEVIRPEWTTIFPLRVAGAIAFADGDPMVPAHRLPLPRVSLLEPRYDQRRFRLELTVRHVVVRQCTIERILPWNECHRNVVAPRRCFRCVETAIITCPIRVPAASI